jgi:hypothetical protein
MLEAKLEAQELYKEHLNFLNTIVDDLPKAYVKKSCIMAINLKIKGMPSINDTPPVKRLPERCYLQFWNGVKIEVEKL